MLSYRLKPGDTIGIIAPAGPIEQEKLERSFSFFLKIWA